MTTNKHHMTNQQSLIVAKPLDPKFNAAAMTEISSGHAYIIMYMIFD